MSPDICNLTFKLKTNLLRHYQKNKSCIPDNKYTSILKDILYQNKDKIQKQTQKLKEKEEEIQKLKNKLYNSVPATTTPPPTNKPKIKLFDYGKEKTDYISDIKVKECLIGGLQGDIDLFKDIHFDPNHPENHTIDLKKGNKFIFMRHQAGKWFQTEQDKISRDFLSQSQQIYRQRLQYKSDNRLEITDDERNQYDKKISWDAKYHIEIKKGISNIVINNIEVEY